ncbi:glycosyltransferase [Chromatium okenii]|uniref:O-linked N-acetylglucosamine transferase family protein n=1 Tax=Chromatium okenii TaxID=61644 RepID=UPI0019033F7B|nr:tetratricopeptide repeat protein [Chromatium okenii]MBK1642766.1 glycosyltransferase [Chromatium okenii]
MNTIQTLHDDALSHHRAGRLDVAESLYRAILALNADHADAHHNLGIIEFQSQRIASGLTHLRRAVGLAPKIGGYWISLADSLVIAEQFDEAHLILEQLKKTGQKLIVKKVSDRIKKSSNRLLAKEEICQVMPYKSKKQIEDLFRKGQFFEAESLARHLVEQYPKDSFSWKALGTILFKRRLFEDALEALSKAVNLTADDAELLNNLGNTLQHLNRPDEALFCYRRSLELNPDYAVVHSSIATTLSSLGFKNEAIDSHRRALALDPNLVDSLNALGVVLKETGRLDEALKYLRKSLELNPQYAEGYNNLGTALQELGKIDEAIFAYRQAFQLNADLTVGYSNLLFALNYHPDKPAEEVFTEYQKFDKNVGDQGRVFWFKHSNNPDPNRCLRIGYVSPDFRSHSTRYFLEPLLAHHDQSDIEVIAYAELKVEDDVTARYRQHVDHWVTTRGLSDASLTKQIRADGIDILVDLAGQTADNRLTVFARRPAPIAVSWLGYGYTTGLSAIDYFLTDDIMAPIGSEHLFAETPWRIAVPSMVYRPNMNMGNVSSLPALGSGIITFGTLTRGIRINHHVVRVWSTILQRLPKSRLMIQSGTFTTQSMQNLIIEQFSAYGIAPERLDVGCRTPSCDVLRDTDISLDCFPHNSGTTLIESLYMGVPFITLAARPSVGRIGSTILHGAGHPEWIAHDEEDYIEKAIALASDLPRLAAIRASLRAELEASPWRDEVGFAKRVEQAYRNMWQIWCKNPT